MRDLGESRESKERLVADLLWFLERESVTGAEMDLCDDLQARIEASAGWRLERAADNLAVRRENPDPSRPKIAFAGHLDTVPQPEKALPVRVEGERIYGRGASDMKAGDAIMLSLLEDFDWSKNWAEPTFIFYAREEGPFHENGLETIFEEMPWTLEVDLALVPEPTYGALEVGCVGTAQVEVTFRGRASHSARPWQGENALTKAGAFLEKLHSKESEKVVVDGMEFHEVVVPTMAKAGNAKNVVPDSFRINVNHRFAPGRGLEHVHKTFEKLLGDSAEFEVVDFAPSGPVNLEHPLLKKLLDTGIEVRPKQAWTDVARFAGRGVAAANLGPGLSSQAHQDEEYAEVPLLTQTYEALRAFLS